jgi:hypothetical protein
MLYNIGVFFPVALAILAIKKFQKISKFKKNSKKFPKRSLQRLFPMIDKCLVTKKIGEMDNNEQKMTNLILNQLYEEESDEEREYWKKFFEQNLEDDNMIDEFYCECSTK